MLALEAQNLIKHYPVKSGFRKRNSVKAVNGISFSLQEGETLAIVGESGCGKSTLARLLIRLEEANQGELKLFGKDVATVSLSNYRQQVQMIFQDPYGSLNPRKRAWQIVSEPLQISQKLSRAEYRKRAVDVMEKVGLRAEMADRYPHMFSGGQRQRLGVARALIMRPRVLICDEPVSALDVSVQAQVLNLLLDLQDEFKFSYIFISHDLSVVKHIANRVAVIYLGRIVEIGPREEIFRRPQHPYTKLLLGSTPHIDGLLEGQTGKILKPIANKGKASTVQRLPNAEEDELPSPLNPPSGCTFHTRCPMATERCRREIPQLENKQGREIACFEVQ